MWPFSKFNKSKNELLKEFVADAKKQLAALDYDAKAMVRDEIMRVIKEDCKFTQLHKDIRGYGSGAQSAESRGYIRTVASNDLAAYMRECVDTMSRELYAHQRNLIDSLGSYIVEKAEKDIDAAMSAFNKTISEFSKEEFLDEVVKRLRAKQLSTPVTIRKEE